MNTRANVICPDGSQCPDDMTCCELASGGYGCCPLPEAVCCSDGMHCCPNGYTCNVANGSCSRGSDSIPMLQKAPALMTNTGVNNVICPDGQSECPDGSSCCKLSSGQYGCCPLPNAVCCSDGEHCCPNGYTCDTSAGTCSKGSKTIIAMSQKTPPLKKIANMNVVCPGSKSECPDGSTCCKLSSGQWGCCPLPNAVCCSDGEHCCPNGYTCDTSAGTCIKGSKATMAMLQKIPALKRTAEASVVCPDGQSECPDGNTCCKLASGQYGCCPLPKAVCCRDGVHCCPNGYTCDTSAGTCYRGSKVVPMLRKVPVSTKIAMVNVVCPDGHSQCPNGNTCCKLSSGQWGCCPLPKAVCCSDGEHCCPNGYTCNVASGSCSRGSDHTVLSQVQSSKKAGENVKTVFCNDGETECPNGYTCCKDLSGQYACCPLENAVCCSDKVHCCPQGYTCNPDGTCHKSSVRDIQKIVRLVESPGQPVTKSFDSVLCPDKKYQCPKGSTCCKLHSGSYGCCPIENAVCCNDDKHCCPEGYTCDVKQGKCNRHGEQISMVDYLPVASMSSEDYVQCPDGSECLDYETCCQIKTGGYGCCPLPNAVCCSDEEHCCPNGYRCDLVSQTCVAGSAHIPMLKKTKTSHHRQKPQKVNLDEKIIFEPGPSREENLIEDVGFHP